MASSSTIVPVPVASNSTPPVGLESVMVKVSFGSTVTSPFTTTFTVWVNAPPAVKFTVVKGKAV